MWGVNNRCIIPERTTLPTAKDVIRCYPLCNSCHELAGFSLDIKSAQKRVCVKDLEHGLLGFTLDSKLFFYRVCPFGATFSAFWWQRLGGWILRFFHQFIWLVHAAWCYVDDYFWIQRKDILPLTSTTMALLCRCLNIPISWRKCELSHTVHWIGWTFHVAAGFIALPERNASKCYDTSINYWHLIGSNVKIWKRPLVWLCGSLNCSQTRVFGCSICIMTYILYLAPTIALTQIIGKA